VRDETADYVAISRLQAAYADVVTRRTWPELEPLFSSDATIHIDRVTAPPLELAGATALGDFIADAVSRFEFFQFVILNAVVDLTGADTAAGRMHIVELRQDRDGGEWSNAFGRYDDEYVRDSGMWRFGARRYRSMARRVGGSPATVLPPPSA
jgi:hypothetical protein